MAQVGTGNMDDETGAPSSLLCVHCGETFRVSFLFPRMRCPHCGTIGYPDRAGLSLLPVGWECPSCGDWNDGLCNFCLSCGAGLPSRCLRCESPVYTSVCSHCGSHQAYLLRLKALETERESRPLVIPAPPPARPEEAPPVGANIPEPPPAVHTARPPRRQRAARRRGYRGGGCWGWLWILAGVVLLLWNLSPDLVGMFRSGELLAYLPDLIPVPVLPQGWQNIPLLSPLLESDPRYLYFFASLALGLALLPVLMILIRRFVRRLFP